VEENLIKSGVGGRRFIFLQVDVVSPKGVKEGEKKTRSEAWDFHETKFPQTTSRGGERKRVPFSLQTLGKNGKKNERKKFS